MVEQRRRVLVVDDEQDIVIRMKRFFERHYPLDVWTASNGYEALGILSKQSFDAVLLDVSMPGISGLEVAADIIKLYPRTIIVIITGSGDHEVIARAKGTRFLIKPVTLDTFKMLLYECFGLVAH